MVKEGSQEMIPGFFAFGHLNPYLTSAGSLTPSL